MNSCTCIYTVHICTCAGVSCRIFCYGRESAGMLPQEILCILAAYEAPEGL